MGITDWDYPGLRSSGDYDLLAPFSYSIAYDPPWGNLGQRVPMNRHFLVLIVGVLGFEYVIHPLEPAL